MHSEAPFLPFAKPFLSEAAIAEVVETLRSGWITTGPRVTAFEAALSEYVGGRRALCVSSATAGLQLALLALKLAPGDEVITTPLTFVATLNTIVQAGGTPVLVDIDPATLNMNTHALEAAITSKTRAIMPVHFAGNPVELDAIYTIAQKHNLRVVEDCAHAIGAEYKGKKLGSFGDIQVFSFHPNKNMTTGEGGAVITDDKEVIYSIERMRFHGIDREAFNRFSKSGSQHYDVITPGFKYNMMDIQAALGLHQLPELESFITTRTKLVERYYDAFKDWEDITLPNTLHQTSATRHAWHLITPLINTIARDDFIAKMKDYNIGVGLHYPACHLYTFYRKTYGFKTGDFPYAESVGSRICSLPLFPTMTESEQERVITAMKQIFGK